MSKTINKNEFILVDSNRTIVEDGAIYLYEYLSLFNVRRFKMVGKDKFQISFDNDSIRQDPLTVNLSDITIIGKVVCVIKDL